MFFDVGSCKVHCSLQCKADCLDCSGSLLLQTEAALIGDYGREQIDYRNVLHMTPQTIPLITRSILCIICVIHQYESYINPVETENGEF